MPTTVTAFDYPRCDPLVVPTNVEELGTGTAFPIGEQIASAPLGSAPNYIPCPGSTPIDSPTFPNQRVQITNLNSFAFSDLWYVANIQTNVGNDDGLVNGAFAFKIDAAWSCGTGCLNTPLISESILADGIFAPGEAWVFVIADYLNNSNPSGPTPLPHLFGAVGVPSAGVGDGSTGSIIGIAVPEPGTGLLVIAGMLGLAGWRRVRA